MRAPAFTVLAGILVALASYSSPGIAWMPLACALGGMACLLTRRATGEPTMTWVVGLSFGLRGSLSLMLFAISSLKLPLFQSYQLEHGLWVFGADGVFYHNQAIQILDAWRIGAPVPAVIPQALMPSLSMAIVYAALGASALHFILINAWLGAMSGLLAYLLAARLSDRRSARAAALLVAFWPSSILWSTQLLKEPLVVALVLSALLLLVALWQQYSSRTVERRRSISDDIAYWGALAASVFALAIFRPHVALVLTLSVGGILAIALGHALVRHRWGESTAAFGITAVVAAATLSGASLDLATLLSSSNHVVAEITPGVVLRDVEAESSQAGAGTGISAGWRKEIHAVLPWLSVDEFAELRRAQVTYATGAAIDTVTFDTSGELLAYLPRAMFKAFLAPFPWQLMSTAGHTGILRPLAAVEILLIAVLLPAIVVGCWRHLRRFRPEAWVVVLFVVGVAVGHGVIVANGGTLFRIRLQFLLPALVLASAALPAFSCRLLDK